MKGSFSRKVSVTGIPCFSENFISFSALEYINSSSATIIGLDAFLILFTAFSISVPSANFFEFAKIFFQINHIAPKDSTLRGNANVTTPVSEGEVFHRLQ